MLNGKRYDAATGEQLSENTPKVESSNPKPTTARQTGSTNRTVDGFVRKRSTKLNSQPVRKPEKSKTLMRGAVKKPAKTTISGKKQLAKAPVITKASAHTDPSREIRASQTKRSRLISKFGEISSKARSAPAPVAKTSEKVSSQATKATKIDNASSSDTRPAGRFQKALDSANSHKQAKAKRPTRRAKVAKKLRISPALLNVSLVLVTVLVLGGYFAFNNVPNLAMRVAATRAGISANLPDYQPAGFSVKGPIKYQPGQIVISFGSKNDQRSYSVSIKKSEWNSETLLDNHVATNNRSYQTFQDKGKTIYIYDGDSASWVDNGTWYEISGNSALNSDQLIRIASSL